MLAAILSDPWSWVWIILGAFALFQGFARGH